MEFVRGVSEDIRGSLETGVLSYEATSTITIVSVLTTLVLLLYDDIYPQELTGTSLDGQEITVKVCPEAINVIVESFDDDVPFSPELNPCFRFLSVKGFDRFVTTIRLFLGGRGNVDDSDWFCGNVGASKYCYTYCPSPQTGLVETRSTEFACLIYDNGYPPNPSLTPTEIDTELLFIDADDATVNDNFFCGTAITTQETFYCLEPCAIYRPVTTNPSPKPCAWEIRATALERIMSKIFEQVEQYLDRVGSVSIGSFTFNLEKQDEEEREFCLSSTVNQERTACTSDTYRWCQPDSQGVYGFPAGETRCIIYLNGPAAAVGVLAATALGGLTTTSSTFLGFGLIGTLGTSGAMALGMCPGPIFCRVGARCCRVIMGVNGLRCPTSC